ncbi:MAG: hypothetical protein QOF78_2144, partial [Phycisphaerales bacterium]|nr:hypothetical protein [Phycisphaerales bacterium]
MLMTSTLYIDYGDRFPSGVLTTTVGALDNTTSGSNPNIDGPVLSDPSNNDYAGGTAVTINATNSLYSGATLTNLRATMTALAQRFYEAYDITVVELTDTLQNVNGHMVRSAANLNEISETLGINEGDSENNDSYIIVGQFLIGASNDNPSSRYGGISTGTDIGGNNNNDGTAFVCLGGSGDSATFNGAQIAHEAGHAFGLEHTYRQNTGSGPAATITNTTATGAQYDQLHQSELMSYLGYSTQGGFNVFSRYPTMDGDGNTDANDLANSPTDYDHFISDPNIGPSSINYITGTGTNDIITVTKTGANSASVAIQAFADAAYATPIDAPGATGNTFSYSISLDRPLTIDAGGRNDRIVLTGDFGITINLRGMQGTDQLIVDGDGASSAVYTTGTNSADGLDGNDDLRGSIALGSTTINFQEFDPLSGVTISDVGSLTVRTGGSDDNLTLNSPAAGQMRVTGNSDGLGVVPVTFFDVGNLTLDTGFNDGGIASDNVFVATNVIATGLNTIAVTTGAGGDVLDINFDAGVAIPAGGLSFDAGGGSGDLLNLKGDKFATTGSFFLTETYTASGPQSGSIVYDGTTSITYSNLAPINDTVTVVNQTTFNATAGDDVINVIDAGTINGFTANQINSGNGTFELWNFANKDAVNVNGLDGADTFTVNAATTAERLGYVGVFGNSSSFTGDDGAADVFNITGSFPNIEMVAWGGDGTDTFTFVGAGAGVGPGVFLSGDGDDDQFYITASPNAPVHVVGGGGGLSGDLDVMTV